MKDFAGKVAVVTGAASGVGLGLARAFATEGMKLVLADVEAGALESAAAELADAGAEVIAVPTDVSHADEVSRLAERTLDAFGEVHVVCNNAGVFASGLSWQTPLEDYEWVFDVNVWGVIHGVRTFVPILLEQGIEAHVVNTASMAAVTAMPYNAVYYMSKHAVMALSESLYLELSLSGSPVGVSVLCPELIATRIDRSERNRPEHLARKSDTPSPERDLVEQAIRDGVATGLPPEALAARVLDGIRERRFYILSDDAWKQSCDTRLEDIRLGRNPTFAPPAARN